MAWYYPTHACGHAGERLQLYGKEDGRQRILAAINRRQCPDCRAAEATAQDNAEGLLPLHGTLKQVSWASSIRAAAINALRASSDPTAPAAVDRAAHIDSARWWIDHRYDLTAAVLANAEHIRG